MTQIQHLDFKLPILFLQFHEAENTIAVIDKSSALRILDETFNVASGFKVNIEHAHDFRKTAFIDNSFSYYVLSKPQTNKALLYDVATKKSLYSIGRNSGEIETIFIDRQKKYIISGGIDGKTFVYSLANAQLLYTLAAHTDYVTSVAVTNTTRLIATGSYDKTIFVNNITTLRNPVKLIGHTDMIVAIEFLNNGKLVSADREGNVIIFDFVKRKVHKRLEKIPDHITTMSIGENRRFLFVGTKLGSVAVYDLEEERQLTHKLVKVSSPITALVATHDGYLVVGTQSGSVDAFKIIEDEAVYEAYIAAKEYVKIYDACRENPFVLYSEAYEKVEQIWKKSLEAARLYLTKGAREKAKAVFKPFSDVREKRTMIQTLMQEFEQYNKFSDCVRNQKYALAYNLATQFKSFVETPLYKQMENEWKSKFNKAQDLIVEADGERKVKELLSPFAGIPSKTKQIQQLFKEKMVMNLFKKKLDAKNFKELFGFIDVHPYLKELDIYQELTQIADTTYINAEKAISEAKYSEARDHIDLLEYFDDFKEDCEELRHKINDSYTLENLYKEEKLQQAYNLIAGNIFLMDHPYALKLENVWDGLQEQAYAFANKGDIKSVLSLLENYFSIESKLELIKKVVIAAYLKRLEYYISKKAPYETIIERLEKLLALTGLTDEIGSFIQLINRVYKSDYEASRQPSAVPFNKKNVIAYLK